MPSYFLAKSEPETYAFQRLVKDKKTKEHASEERDRVVELAFDRGVLFLGCGPSTVRISPGLVVSKDEAEVAVDVLEEAISILEK